MFFGLFSPPDDSKLANMPVPLVAPVNIHLLDPFDGIVVLRQLGAGFLATSGQAEVSSV